MITIYEQLNQFEIYFDNNNSTKGPYSVVNISSLKWSLPHSQSLKFKQGNTTWYESYWIRILPGKNVTQ